MTTRQTITFRIAMLALAVLYWAIINGLEDTREPWDGALYWILTYPLACALAAALAWLRPQAAWQWGAIMIGAQVVFLVGAGMSPMLVPGMLMIGVLASPAILLCWMIGRFRRARLRTGSV